MQRFADLAVWQRSHRFTLAVYKVTRNFPIEERYGLTSQLRRAAASVPTNIAEGSKRKGRMEYARFLNIAEGSMAETEYLLVLSRDLGYVTSETAKTALAESTEIQKMLNALRGKVERG